MSLRIRLSNVTDLIRVINLSPMGSYITPFANLGATKLNNVEVSSTAFRPRYFHAFHRHVVAKASFSSIDSHIWQLLWKWASRRHPMKGARWVRNRYFRIDGHRSWDFATRGSADANISGRQLFRAMTISITRHVKIRGLANPFDPAWTTYFAHRRIAKRSVKLFGATPWC